SRRHRHLRQTTPRRFCSQTISPIFVLSRHIVSGSPGGRARRLGGDTEDESAIARAARTIYFFGRGEGCGGELPERAATAARNAKRELRGSILQVRQPLALAAASAYPAYG